MPSLPDDVWRQIGLHLKPRHLVKLMATNKHICSIVDNETYWARVAFHLIWREIYEMEFVLVCEEQASCLELPTLEGDLYHLSCVPNGYKWAIDQTFARVDQCAKLYPDIFSFWSTARHLSPRDQVFLSCEGLRAIHYEHYDVPSETELTKSMKKVVQWQFTKEFHAKPPRSNKMLRDRMYRQANEEIDDIFMAISEKRKVVKIIGELYFKIDNMIRQ